MKKKNTLYMASSYHNAGVKINFTEKQVFATVFFATLLKKLVSFCYSFKI